jgi:hypothetical protein
MPHARQHFTKPESLAALYLTFRHISKCKIELFITEPFNFHRAGSDIFVIVAFWICI